MSSASVQVKKVAPLGEGEGFTTKCAGWLARRAGHQPEREPSAANLLLVLALALVPPARSAQSAFLATI